MKFKNELIALFSGFSWAVSGVLLSTLSGEYIFGANKTTLIFLAPIFFSAISDTFVSFMVFVYNMIKGNLRDLKNAFKTKTGRITAIAAIIGGPIGQCSYLMAISMAGPAYAIPISGLTPMFGALLSWIFLKEKINLKIIVGIFGCIIGAFIISYVKPEGVYPNFYLGVFLAILAAFSWSVEATLITYLTKESVKEEVAFNIRSMVSAIGVICILIVLGTLGEGVTTIFSKFDVWTVILVSSCFAAVSFVTFYKGMTLNGVAKGMALNSTFSIWSVILSVIFVGTQITFNLILGVLIVIFAVLILTLDFKFLNNSK